MSLYKILFFCQFTACLSSLALTCERWKSDIKDPNARWERLHMTELLFQCVLKDVGGEQLNFSLAQTARVTPRCHTRTLWSPSVGSAHRISTKLSIWVLGTKTRWEEDFSSVLITIPRMRLNWDWYSSTGCVDGHSHVCSFLNFTRVIAVLFSACPAVVEEWTHRIPTAVVAFSWQAAHSCAQRDQPQNEHQLWICSHHICMTEFLIFGQRGSEWIKSVVVTLCWFVFDKENTPVCTCK